MTTTISKDEGNKLASEEGLLESYAVSDSLTSLVEAGAHTRFASRIGTFKRFFLVLSDSVVFTAAVVIAYVMTMLLKAMISPEAAHPSLSSAVNAYPYMFLLPMIALIASCHFKGHYSRFKSAWEEVGEFWKTGMAILGITIACLYLVKSEFSRAWLVSSWMIILLGVPLARLFTKKLLASRGRWLTPAIVIGSGRNALDAALALESDFNLGFSVKGLVDLESLWGDISQNKDELRNIEIETKDPLTNNMKRYPVLRVKEDIELLLTGNSTPYIIFALEAVEFTKYQSFVDSMMLKRRNLSIIPPLKGMPLVSTEISPIFRHEALHLRVKTNLAGFSSTFIKRIFDLLFSMVALVLLSPFIFVLAVLIKSDGGSVFYGQQRIGYKGRVFKCWKFRSMCTNADTVLKEVLESDLALKKEYLATEKLKNDPRVTKIGSFIRKYSIDELPQFFNVLRGQMSIVGPRPVRPDELVEKYGRYADLYKITPPGITGIWQVSGRNDLEYGTRVRLDTWYVRNWSLWGDIQIIFKTVGVVLKGEGAY